MNTDWDTGIICRGTGCFELLCIECVICMWAKDRCDAIVAVLPVVDERQALFNRIGRVLGIRTTLIDNRR